MTFFEKIIEKISKKYPNHGVPRTLRLWLVIHIARIQLGFLAPCEIFELFEPLSNVMLGVTTRRNSRATYGICIEKIFVYLTLL